MTASMREMYVVGRITRLLADLWSALTIVAVDLLTTLLFRRLT